jgi:uncharacterized membrane-anchored protein
VTTSSLLAVFLLATLQVSAQDLADEATPVGEDLGSFQIGDQTDLLPALDSTPEQTLAHFVEQGANPELAQGMAAEFENIRFEEGLDWQFGTVSLGDDLATLEVPEGCRWLGPDDAVSVLREWGNPIYEPPLGMLFAGEGGPFDDGSIGVIFDFVDDGFVDDSDAGEIDYDELLEDMKDSTNAANSDRLAAGFGSIELIRWADPPRYDAVSKHLIRAKELKFSDAPDGLSTLNYDVRALGRRGVLSMNAVSSLSQISQVRVAMEEITGGLAFSDGNSYGDFDPELDKVAAYGIGALASGKLALKAGLFKGLIALLIAGKKFVIIGLIGLAAVIKSVVGKGKD